MQNPNLTTPDKSSEMLATFKALGLEKQLGILAALLGVVAFFAPMVSVETGGFFGSGGSISFALTQAGFSGFLVLVLSVALGIAPFFLPKEPRFELAYFGLSSAAAGTVLVVLFVSLSLPAMVSAVGHLSLAFYALLASFGIATYISAMRCYRAMQHDAP